MDALFYKCILFILITKFNHLALTFRCFLGGANNSLLLISTVLSVVILLLNKFLGRFRMLFFASIAFFITPIALSVEFACSFSNISELFELSGYFPLISPVGKIGFANMADNCLRLTCADFFNPCASSKSYFKEGLSIIISISSAAFSYHPLSAFALRTCRSSLSTCRARFTRCLTAFK